MSSASIFRAAQATEQARAALNDAKAREAVQMYRLDMAGAAYRAADAEVERAFNEWDVTFGTGENKQVAAATLQARLAWRETCHNIRGATANDLERACESVTKAEKAHQEALLAETTERARVEE